MEEWAAYYEVEPWGSPADDDRWRNLLALQYSAHGGKEEVRWFDRDPDWTQYIIDLQKPPMDDSIEAYFEARLKAQERPPSA